MFKILDILKESRINNEINFPLINCFRTSETDDSIMILDERKLKQWFYNYALEVETIDINDSNFSNEETISSAIITFYSLGLNGSPSSALLFKIEKEFRALSIVESAFINNSYILNIEFSDVLVELQ